MDENPNDPAPVVADPTSTTPSLRSPAAGVPHAATDNFRSSSLPHQGDLIMKLIEDASKPQSANAELERTKLLLREAEHKLASSSEDNKLSFLSKELDETKQQLRRANDALKAEQKKNGKLEDTFKAEQKEVEKLEADNTWLGGSLKYHQDLLDSTKSYCLEAENKLQTFESRASIDKAELRKKDTALEQKGGVFQSKLHGYRAILQRLKTRSSDIDPVVDGVFEHVRSVFYRDTNIIHILHKLETFKFQFEEDVDELGRKLEQEDLCQIQQGK